MLLQFEARAMHARRGGRKFRRKRTRDESDSTYPGALNAMDEPNAPLLTINTGSSSLKTAVYRLGEAEHCLVTAEAKQIGLPMGRIRIEDGAGEVLQERDERLPDHAAALGRVLAWLKTHRQMHALAGVGHRIVHGGRNHDAPQWINQALLEDLHALVPLAPEHLPQAIGAIEKVKEMLGDVPQAACFDTSFHSTLPRCARLLPLPRAMADGGIVRYGFHGLSYEYLVGELRKADPKHAGGRAVLAHLGNGASMAAVLRGRSIDTSMGFTPAGGLVMGTRTGDVDPGVLVYLLNQKGYTPESLNRLVNQESGMLGISSQTPDMRELLGASERDPAAAEAVEIFCYQARKFLGAYAAALGGLDNLVFTGGIGERASFVRERICAGLDFLGIRLSPKRNAEHAEVISTNESRVTVRVIETEEDLMIARHTHQLLTSKE